jgi:hypothetical protein
VTVSLPDDVAEHLDAIPARQVSAYVTEAVRRRRASDDMRAVLAAAGHPGFPYDLVASAGRLAGARVPDATREAALRRLAAVVGRPVKDVRREFDRATE